MSKANGDFLSWATDPARTLEERFGVLRLVEYTYQRYYRGGDKQHRDWRETSKSNEKRLYNPAYLPQIAEDRLRITAELLPEVVELNLIPIAEDRPLRNFAFLAFVPNVTSLRLSGIECDHLDGLQHLTKLRELYIQSPDLEDYGALAACRELREIQISTKHPWPSLHALSELPHLEKLTWMGNGRALADLPALPSLKTLHIESNYYEIDSRNSIRDFHQLPAMPQLEHLWAGWFYRLDGIERYPCLRFLAVRGYFKSLAGLAGLPAVSHLRLTCPQLEEVATIAGMPSVIHLAVHSERPQDWGVLMESETLREVFHIGFNGDQPDLETLRMLIPSRDDLFAAAAPRPLDPIRLMVRGSDDELRGSDCEDTADFPEGAAGWNGNLGMRQSENWWVEERLHSALAEAGYLKLQGVRFDISAADLYTLFSSAPPPWARRQVSITILKTEAIGLMPGIFQCLREALSQMRHPWLLYVTVDPDPQADTWDESWKKNHSKSYAEEMEELDRELENKRQRKQIFLTDQHRMRLLQELGEGVEDFKPSPLPASTDELDSKLESNAESEEDLGDDDEDDHDDSMDGGIANFDPENAKDDEAWLPDVDVGDPNQAWNNLCCMFILTEQGIHMHAKNRGIESIADLFDIVPERVE